jgi:hypothetical protein
MSNTPFVKTSGRLSDFSRSASAWGGQIFDSNEGAGFS